MDWNSCSINGVPTINCIPGFYTLIVNSALYLVGLVAFVLIIYGGIRFITSSGGKQAEEAQKIITYAIIGLILVLLSFFIVYVIGDLTGANCIQVFGFHTCSTPGQ